MTLPGTDRPEATPPRQGRVAALGAVALGLGAAVVAERSGVPVLDHLFAVVVSPDPWTWLVALCVLPVIGFPISVFYLHAGLAFGPVQGVLLTWTGLLVNMTLSYHAAAYLFREPLLAWLTRMGWKPPTLDPMNQFRLVFLMRTVPGPPFPVQNYLLALAGVQFRTYLVVSILCQGTIAVGMICLGSLIGDWRQPATWGLLGVLLVLLLVLRGWYQARFRRG